MLNKIHGKALNAHLQKVYKVMTHMNAYDNTLDFVSRSKLFAANITNKIFNIHTE